MSRTEMSIERFKALTDAYGAEIDRWPVETRQAARLAASEPACRVLLDEARSLDTLLDGWRVPAPTAALIGRIVAHAPTFARRARIRRRLWWSGIGVAAALAGAVAGSVTVAVVLAESHNQQEITTAFGGFSDAEL